LRRYAFGASSTAIFITSPRSTRTSRSNSPTLRRACSCGPTSASSSPVRRREWQSPRYSYRCRSPFVDPLVVERPERRPSVERAGGHIQHGAPRPRTRRRPSTPRPTGASDAPPALNRTRRTVQLAADVLRLCDSSATASARQAAGLSFVRDLLSLTWGRWTSSRACCSSRPRTRRRRVTASCRSRSASGRCWRCGTRHNPRPSTWTILSRRSKTLPATYHVFGNEVGEAVKSIKTAWRLTCR
jgi:hypothetical protein